MSTSHHVEDIVDQDGQTHKVDVFVFNNPKSIKKIEDKKVSFFYYSLMFIPCTPSTY